MSLYAITDSRKNVDSFTYYHGPTRGFHSLLFIPEPPPTDLTFLPIAGGMIVLMLLIFWCLECAKRRMQHANREAARIAMLRKQVQEGVESDGIFSFGMALVSVREFLASKRFIPFEELRDSGHLKVRFPPFSCSAWEGTPSTHFRPLQMLDTVESAKEFSKKQTIIFFSHQWLAWEEPDPDNVHYKCMSEAVGTVLKRSRSSIENSWVWLDYRHLCTHCRSRLFHDDEMT